jgi:hypothetical protein
VGVFIGVITGEKISDEEFEEVFRESGCVDRKVSYAGMSYFFNE